MLYGVGNSAFANYDRATSQLLTEKQLEERGNYIEQLIRPEISKVFYNTSTRSRCASAINAKRNLTPPIPVGRQVMVKDPTRSNKHQPYWFGP